MPAASTAGVRVFCPETKLPPTVVQMNVKLESAEEPTALRLVTGTTQFNCAGGAMTVVGGGNCTTVTLFVAGHMEVPVTVTV